MGMVVLQLVLGLRILNLTIHRLETELRILNLTIHRLETEPAEQLDRHADAAILRSMPGVGVVLAGRMLSEFGDDPTRFTNPASRREYAGTAPVTKASGKGRVVLMRRIRNTRLFRHLPGLVVQRGQRLPGRPGAVSAPTPARRRPREGAPPGREQTCRPT
jgi:transposase